ncbi:MAG: GAP family protein [Mycolicibacterium aromaticivorans]|nr:GAP family protein [Mycolicibacterium aromaticivorans]
MWGIVSLLGLSVAAEPLRIGIAMLLTSRPRPLVNLVAFWLGSLIAGIVVALGAFVVCPDLVSDALHIVTSSIASLTGGHARLIGGIIALCVAAGSAARSVRRPMVGARQIRRKADRAARPPASSAISRVALRTRELLQTGRPWVSFAAGLSQGPAPVEYLAAISVIHASCAAIGTQVGASVTFTVATLAAVEVLLVSFVLRPARTQSILANARDCLQRYRQHITTVGAGMLGIVMVVGGGS